MKSAGAILLALCLLATFPLRAIFVVVPTPEQLAEKADLICTGQVLDIVEDATGKSIVNRPPVDPGNLIPVTAKVKVLHVFKGQLPSEIKIKYILQLIVVGYPAHMDITKDSRYRFYLQKNLGEQPYIGVVLGAFNDVFAAMPLAANEADDSIPISKTEAQDIAIGWLKEKHPDLVSQLQSDSLRPMDGFHSDGRWYVPVGLKMLVILSNRTVDEKTWAVSP
jgi:hypothetical protein